MSAKHTPGPWAHKPRARDGHVDIVCKGHAEFVHVGCPHVEKPILDYPHDNEQTANARLIAAAPDMAEALRVALDALRAADAVMCKIGQAAADGDADGVLFEVKSLPHDRNKIIQADAAARAALEKAGAA